MPPMGGISPHTPTKAEPPKKTYGFGKNISEIQISGWKIDPEFKESRTMQERHNRKLCHNNSPMNKIKLPTKKPCRCETHTTKTPPFSQLHEATTVLLLESVVGGAYCATI